MSTALLERAPKPALIPAPRTSEPSPPVERAKGSAWTLTLSAVAALAVLGWVVLNAGAVHDAAVVLSRLQPGWLLIAAAAAGATWLCSAVSQQGAVGEQLPRRRLVAVQFAGTFANQFTPAGLGGGAVNVRFLVRKGTPQSEAVAAVGLTQLAGVAVHSLLLAGVLLFDPSLLSALPHVSGWLLPALAVLGAAALVLATAKLDWVAKRLSSLWSQAMSALSHLRRPRRVAELLLGSLGLTLAHIVVLYGILRALGAHPSFVGVAAGYLLATTVAALVPSPGGLGSLDGCLGMLLYGSGVTSSTAIAAVLAYRLLTSWLALAPSAFTLHLLVRNGVV